MLKEITDELKNALKNRIMSSVSAVGKQDTDISNYAINRLASKSYNLTVFWKGKTEKGDTRFVRVGLGNRLDVVVTVMEIMEEMLEKIGNYDILDDLEPISKEVREWGKNDS